MADAAVVLQRRCEFPSEPGDAVGTSLLLGRVEAVLAEAGDGLGLRREQIAGVVFASKNPLYCLNTGFPAVHLHHRLGLPPSCHIVHGRDDPVSLELAIRLICDARNSQDESRYVLTLTVDETAALTVSVLNADAVGRENAARLIPSVF